MNFSYQWLQQYLPGLQMDPSELAQQITMRTAECEGVTLTDASDLDGTQDSIIEINNKSLTNRPDLWGHFGLAREISAFRGLELVDPVKALPSTLAPGTIKIHLDDPTLCSRYSAVLLEGIEVGPSPAWLQRRLNDIGMTSRNLLVDLTNYIMMELGQPTHAFDADKLGTSITIRRAEKDSTFAALNGESYFLTSDDIVIANQEGAVALAGIIGGADTAISATTTRVLIESATFPFHAVRKTSSRLHLRTDASMRFEKGQDPENTMRALTRIVDLLQETMDVRLVAIVDTYPTPIACPTIELDLDWAERRLGRSLCTEEIISLFEALRFGITELAPRRLSLRVPSWRATKDVSIREDLLEEIGRILGYDSIVAQAPVTQIAEPRANPTQDQMHALRNTLIARGFTEVSNYSFCPDAAIATFGYDISNLLQIANPIISNQNYLRPELIPGICQNLVDNLRYFTEFRLFEAGRIYRQGSDGQAVEQLEGAVAMYSLADDASQLFELKHIAQMIAPDVVAYPATAWRSFEHPSRTADLKVGDTVVGRLFELIPSMLTRGRAAILTLDLDLLRGLPEKQKSHQPSRRFPTSHFDLSIVADAHTPVGVLQALLSELGGESVLSLLFLQAFDLPADQKSVSFRLVVGASDHTLTSEAVAEIRAKIVSGLGAAGYSLRV